MATHLSIFAWKNSKDRGDWWAIVQEVAKEWETTEWLNTSRSQYIDIMLLHFTKNCFKIYKTKFIQFKMLTERLIQHMATKQVTHKLTTPSPSFRREVENNSGMGFFLQHLSTLYITVSNLEPPTYSFIQEQIVQSFSSLYILYHIQRTYRSIF